MASLPPPPPVRRSIVLASEERAGSEWLGQLLGATGRLGRPMEYLNQPWNMRFVADYPEELERQLVAAHHAGTTPNGIFSMKLHAWHFDRLRAAARLTEVFPDPVFVRLRRRDRLGQAISLARARQTMRFHEHTREIAPEHFDAELIERTMAEMLATSARWDRFFLRNGIEPLLITYEELQADPVGAVQAIAALVDEEVLPSDVVVAREMKVQRDDLNEDWRRRFLSDLSDLDRFD